MPRKRTRNESPTCRRTSLLTGLFLILVCFQNKFSDKDSGDRGLSEWFPMSSKPNVLMVDGFLSSGNVCSYRSTSNMAPSIMTIGRCRRRIERKMRDTDSTTIMLLVDGSDTDKHTNSTDERQVLEILWSYVNNLQRARNTKGETKAIYSLAHYLESNTMEIGSHKPFLLGAKPSKDHVRYTSDDLDKKNKFVDSFREAIERALVPALRQAGESKDYRIILRLISGAIAFVNNLPILTPRIFGEALNALSHTQANASKLKKVWNAMVMNPEDVVYSKMHIDGVVSYSMPSYLASGPTAFELNTYIKAMSALGKSKACINIYRTHCAGRLENDTETSLDVFIKPDAYTISILLSILTDSISADQKMCEPVKFSTTMKEKTYEDKSSLEQQGNSPSAPESLQSKIELLTYSTCWQWNAAVELLGTLPIDGDHGSNESRRQEIQWRNNHVYSSLLKLQDRADNLCSQHINSSWRHRNGPELTMSILDDMIQNHVIPDAVTCTLAIKAMGRAVASTNRKQTLSSASIYHERKNNLAVAFLERMKSDPRLPQPNQYSYSAAIKACARLKDHRTALHLLEETRINQGITTTASTIEYGTRVENMDNNISIPPPNTWVYNAALLSLDNKEKRCLEQTTKGRNNKQIRKLWSQRNKEMDEKERTDVALSLLYQMKNDNQHYELDTTPDTVTYNTILGVGTFPHQFKTNESSAGVTPLNSATALSLIELMKEEDVARDMITYRNAIESSVNDNDVIDILRLYREDSSLLNQKTQNLKGIDMTNVFNVGLHTLLSRQAFPQFKHVLSFMFDHQIPTDGETLTALIYAVGRNQKCSSLVNLIELLEISEGQLSNKNSSIHRELFESVEIIGSSSDLHKLPALKDHHYAQAINICLKENKFANANVILSKMRGKGFNPNTRCMEDFALAYAQSAMDSFGKQEQEISNDGKLSSVARASKAYEIVIALTDPRTSTLGRVARACALTGQWKLCRALTKAFHNSIVSAKEDESSIRISPLLLQTIRGTHSFILRQCAKQGSIYASLHHANDIQEFAKRIRAQNKLDNQNLVEKPKVVEYLTGGEDIFQNLRNFTDIPSSNTNVGMQPNDWTSVIRAASKSGHWRVCLNALQILRPYVENVKLVDGEKKSRNSRDERYDQLSRALYAVMRSLESYSQDAWAVRVIEDWIGWCGRQPQVESILSAIRLLSSKGRTEEIRNLMATCLRNDLSSTETRDEDLSYEEKLYIGAVTSLHNNGLYDDADELFMSGIKDGLLPFNFYRADGQPVLDLHGLNIALAHSAVRIAMRQQAAAFSEDETSRSNMMIITGRGRHSEFHLRPILRPEVQRMLLEEFYPPVNTMSVPGNIGALIVFSRDVEAWQEHQNQQKGMRMLELAAVLRTLCSQERLKTLISLKFSSESHDSG